MCTKYRALMNVRHVIFADIECRPLIGQIHQCGKRNACRSNFAFFNVNTGDFGVKGTNDIFFLDKACHLSNAFTGLSEQRRCCFFFLTTSTGLRDIELLGSHFEHFLGAAVLSQGFIVFLF